MTKRAALLLFALALVQGCTFSWDSGGIEDVKLAGRTPAELAPAPVPEEPGDAEKAAAEDDEDEAAKKLRRIAVLPVAYADATGGQACDLCPADFEMKPTSAAAARLATGFLYEAVARHPRLLFMTPAAVESAVAASPDRSLRASAAALGATGKAEVVVVAALGELRPRVGPDDAPETPAGARVFMALVQARSGEVLWSDTFDGDEKGRGFVKGTYDKVVNDDPIRWSTAEGFTEQAIDELVDELVDEIE